MSTMPTLDMDEDIFAQIGYLCDVLCKIGHLGLFERDLSRYTLEVLVVDSQNMRELNRTHRAKDSTTDVLSFPLDTLEGESKDDVVQMPQEMTICLGSIVINLELAEQVAQKRGHSVQEEVSLLFIHGLLHILGFNHEVDNGEQRAMEQRIIESLGFKESLIVREMDTKS
ncbi:rRNA maturation RNase YbeY [Helicobacter sp. MIT 21-1697]|uniref:rRNA maturation RNase YbeY n=1 Tax=Helicobacter sp. MIT 21-1697 TaxID=2993733 RepID=UPI00224AD7A3|nr:rRNA maturation RNase YbeY [Helicobacter sp. MIT 21-1697]MCX2717129.1 rRNA maturation RNase YbeY [Helicobacter sp. MIT 21-1697]